jgi:hypothetical protein
LLRCLRVVGVGDAVAGDDFQPVSAIGQFRRIPSLAGCRRARRRWRRWLRLLRWWLLGSWLRGGLQCRFFRRLGFIVIG